MLVFLFLLNNKLDPDETFQEENVPVVLVHIGTVQLGLQFLSTLDFNQAYKVSF